jgi:hypothetical protein
MTKRNAAAIQLWEQVFASLAKTEDATLVDPEHDEAQDETRLRKGFAEAGWSEEEIQSRIELHRAQEANAPVTSPGVAPHVEFIFDRLCVDVEAAMTRLRLDSHSRIARGVIPRAGPIASLTNVIMTDEGIISVGSFFFRYCGLIARAFLRTLQLAPTFWQDHYSEHAARRLLIREPDLLVYWLKIFLSFGITGTQIMVPFRPAKRHELVVFEQVARAMEIFAVAHEYGHHHLNHGRSVCEDPKSEEFAADQFALKIGYEVERISLEFANPYLASGAGGVILLGSLETLRLVRESIKREQEVIADTHPEISARLARFDTIAVLKPAEFVALKSFRTVSLRILETTRTMVVDLLKFMPEDAQNQLQRLNAEIARGSE